jgi:hypothetical protein
MSAQAAVVRDQPARKAADVVWIFTVRRPKKTTPRPVQLHPSHLRTATPVDARLRPFVCALADLVVADVLRYPRLDQVNR